MKNWVYACTLLLAGSLFNQAQAAGKLYEYDVVTDITIALTLTAQDGVMVVTNRTRTSTSVTETSKMTQYKISNRTIIDATAAPGRPFSASAKLVVARDGSMRVQDPKGVTNDVSTGIFVAWMLPVEDVPFQGVYSQTYANGIRTVRDKGEYITPSCLLLGGEALMVGLETGKYGFTQPRDGLFPADGVGWKTYKDGAGYWLYNGTITVAGPSEGKPNAGWLKAGMWPIEGTITYKDRAVKTQVQ